MTRSRTLQTIGGLALAALVTACGGGGSDGGAAPAPGGGEDSGLSDVSRENQVVVRYDRNGDDRPDTLTLDASDEFAVVDALDGTDDGGVVDVSDALRGQAVDPAVAEAVGNHLATSFGVASETRLDVVLADGRTITVTVFE